MALHARLSRLPFARLQLLILLALSSSGCGYNSLQTTDEDVKASWAEVVNQYKRRADLIPNLVRTVEGFAKQERDVLIGVTQARAKVGTMQVSPDTLKDPKAFADFEAAQGSLSSALSRLMVVSERYPELKSDARFGELQAQLEGTENRIAVARNRYIDAVKAYNTVVRSFPSNLTANLFDFEVKPSFTVANEAAIAEAPQVQFGQ